MTTDALSPIIVKELERLASPHPCPGCGDMTCASLCAACQEWAGRVLAMDEKEGF